MRFIALVLVLIGLAVPCYAENSKIEVRGSIDDGSGTIQDSGLITKYFPSGVIQQQTVSLDSSTFTTITVPINAKALLIDMMSADGITLKGVTADVGISLDSTCPVLLPLSSDSSTMTLGIRNDERAGNKIRLYWF